MITLVPSRYRPELLKKFLQSAIDAETTTDGLILIDSEDSLSVSEVGTIVSQLKLIENPNTEKIL